MPIYEYRCTVCGRQVEVMHRIGERGPKDCEACGGAMRKALSAPAIHFKGSGWAKKDAAAASARKTPSSSPDPDAGGTAAGADKTSPEGDKASPGGERAGAAAGSGASGSEAGTGSAPAAKQSD